MGVKANSVLYLQCGKWIHGGFAGMKRVTQEFMGNLACRRCEENIGEAVEWEEKLCHEVETVREFTYLADSMNADGGREAALKMKMRDF